MEPMPEINQVRWALLVTAIAGAGAAAGGGVLTWIGGGLAVLAGAGLLWLILAPTIIPRSLTLHEESDYDDPEGRYKHGYYITLVPLREPLRESLRVVCDAPVLAAFAKIETPTRGRQPADCIQFRRFVFSTAIGGLPVGTGIHIYVYSRRPIRTVWLYQRKQRRVRL